MESGAMAGETLRTSVAVGFALLMSAHAHAQAQPQIPCLTTGDLVTGVLKFAQDTHPNGTLMKAYVLRLPTPRCAVDKFPPAGANPMFGVAEIHLVSPQDKQGPPLSSLVGQTITV